MVYTMCSLELHPYECGFLTEAIKIIKKKKSEAVCSLLPSLLTFLNRISQQLVDFKEEIFKIITTVFALSQILGPGRFLAQ